MGRRRGIDILITGLLAGELSRQTERTGSHKRLKFSGISPLLQFPILNECGGAKNDRTGIVHRKLVLGREHPAS
jgi:hypothetical protein